MATHIAPFHEGDAFNCPHCGVYAKMRWNQLYNGAFSHYALVSEVIGDCCQKASYWLDPKKTMIWPNKGAAPLAEEAMPEDVKQDYDEAAQIFSQSPRGAAALLRLGLQKLCVHLGENGNNINEDIRALAAKDVVPPLVIKVADTVRITGNNAVHPGEMSDADFDHVASKMFDLLNFIVKKGIVEPEELKQLYERTPETPRKMAEAKDKR